MYIYAIVALVSSFFVRSQIVVVNVILLCYSQCHALLVRQQQQQLFNILPYLGKYEDAIAVYDKILAMNPHAPNAIGRKGLVLYDVGRSAEAVTYFDRVLATEPNNTDALFYKGLALDRFSKVW